MIDSSASRDDRLIKSLLDPRSFPSVRGRNVIYGQALIRVPGQPQDSAFVRLPPFPFPPLSTPAVTSNGQFGELAFLSSASLAGPRTALSAEARETLDCLVFLLGRAVRLLKFITGYWNNRWCQRLTVIFQ